MELTFQKFYQQRAHGIWREKNGTCAKGAGVYEQDGAATNTNASLLIMQVPVLINIHTDATFAHFFSQAWCDRGLTCARAFPT